MLHKTIDKDCFQFKRFSVKQDICTMKVNTDGVLLGAWSADHVTANRVLDIGTGTGVIALMIAQKRPDVMIDAIDIDALAFQQARQNFMENELGANIICHLMALQEFCQSTSGSYDLIISNPPFFTGGTFSDNENKANVRHTIKLSHGELLGGVRQLLHSHGVFDVILPYTEGLQFVKMASKYGLFLQKKTEVITRENKDVERLLLRFSKNENSAITINKLLIKHADGQQYSKEYIRLTKDYYLFL